MTEIDRWSDKMSDDYHKGIIHVDAELLLYRNIGSLIFCEWIEGRISYTLEKLHPQVTGT